MRFLVKLFIQEIQNMFRHSNRSLKLIVFKMSSHSVRLSLLSASSQHLTQRQFNAPLSYVPAHLSEYGRFDRHHYEHLTMTHTPHHYEQVEGAAHQAKTGDLNVYPLSVYETGKLSLISSGGVRYEQRRYLHKAPTTRIVPTAFDTTQVPDMDIYRRDTAADEDPRIFTYLAVGAAGALGAAATKSTVMNLLGLLAPAADTLAAGTVEVDLSSIPLGKNAIIKWRGKPVFIRHRTPEDLAVVEAVDVTSLRDPQKDSDRVQKSEWLVMLGICTHLGCVPLGDSGDYNGWYCPCHGSHYDLSGRIRKGPAPYNLEVPEYKFVTDTTIVLG